MDELVQSDSLSVTTSSQSLPHDLSVTSTLEIAESNEESVSSHVTSQPAAGSSITASALFEIISTIVTAANVDTPTNNEQDNKSEGTSSQTATPIQVQLHLNTQQQPSPPDNNEDRKEEQPLKSRGRGKKITESEKSIQPWHYHLGGVRQKRVPLSPEIKEALEVAYISRIMSKNFRKEGQPEKERISRITGLEIEKVHEWFKNRRKKDKLLQTRVKDGNTISSRRGRKRIIPNVLNTTPIGVAQMKEGEQLMEPQVEPHPL